MNLGADWVPVQNGLSATPAHGAPWPAAPRGAGGGDGVDVGFGHEKTLLLFIFLERTSLPRCMTQKERGNCVVTARSTSSLIRTVTVGSGIAPDRAAKMPLADYTAGGEFHPAPKTIDPVVFAIMIQQTTEKCKRKFQRKNNVVPI